MAGEKKKKIAFFHIGDHYVAFKVFAKLLDYEAIDLPKPNQESISYGLSISPEFSCFPFKVFTGTFVQAAKMGANIILLNSGKSISSCQYSDFAYVQKQLFKKNKLSLDIIIIEGMNPKEMYSKLKPYKKDITITQVTEAMILMTQKSALIDSLDHFSRKIYIEEGKKESENFRKKFLKMIDTTNSIIELYSLNKKMKAEFSEHPKINIDKMLKIAVIGDIYSINIDYLNNKIFERLSNVGVYSQKGHIFSDVINSAIGFSKIESEYIKKARKYLKHNVGGFSLETVATAIRYAEKKYDGLIHIYPFNCMPETVVRSILPKIAKDYDIPILYLPIDEQTGDAGFTTRVDAFIDLLKVRKEKKAKEKKAKKKNGEKNGILPWN